MQPARLWYSAGCLLFRSQAFLSLPLQNANKINFKYTLDVVLSIKSLNLIPQQFNLLHKFEKIYATKNESHEFNFGNYISDMFSCKRKYYRIYLLKGNLCHVLNHHTYLIMI
jgi:hypothetical protein